ncbi:MAG: AAA family ATPase [Woeseiaceae bacterium]|nr:AAA family ATPase [Woeseiaceae bacterium]
MLITPNRANLNKIVVLNPKGGCGKTTLVTNIASTLAARGPMPTVMDCDPQGSTMRWLEKRPSECAPIYGIAAYKRTMQATRSWQLRIPEETMAVIVDSPAGLSHDDLRDLTRDATSIVVPVLPSAIDIHAASRCIADLLLVAKVDRQDNKLAVVANRTRRNTRSYAGLMRFLDSLGIPVIGILRDSQHFVLAAESGLGVGELSSSRARQDAAQLDDIVDWLCAWRNRGRNEALDRTIRESSNVTELRKP